MVKNLFIFNFKKRLPYAFFTAVLLVVCIETCLAVAYRTHYIKLVGDKTTPYLLSKIENLKYPTQISTVILGNCLALDIEKAQDDPSILNVSTNNWASMAGQYFMLKTTLDHGLRPKLCVFVYDLRTLSFEFETFLDLYKGDSYFFEPFASWSNIWELFFNARRPDLAARMCAKGLMPSARLKLKIFNFLQLGALFDEDRNRSNSLSREENEMLAGDSSGKVSTLSKFYLKRIRDLCKKHNIKLLLLEAFVSEGAANKKVDHAQAVKELKEILLSPADTTAVIVDTRIYYPDSWFYPDGRHPIDGTVKMKFGKKVYEIINKFLSENKRS